jgi:phosphoglycerol transferase MdoB-like AlkP superfamily enzyme
MMGFSNPFALGHDIFNIKNDNIIVFPNGNFLTESVYYNNSKSEYKVLKESAIIDETYIQECKDYAEEILELSNDIIVYDLINTEGDKITSESSSE